MSLKWLLPPLFIILLIPKIVLAQNPNVKLGVGINHLYDLYEGPLELSGETGNVPYDIVDIDLKGLNGEYTQFDLGFSVLSHIELNNLMTMRLSLTNGSMTSQFDNQYAKSNLTLVNMGFRRYFRSQISRYKTQAYPFVEVGFGITYFEAQRFFIKDQGLFSETSGIAFSNAISTGCLFALGRKISLDIAPTFIINHSDAVDGYLNKGSDIMMQTSIGFLFNLN